MTLGGSHLGSQLQDTKESPGRGGGQWVGWLADGQTGSERSYPASQLQVAVWSSGGMVRGVNSSVFKEEYGAGSWLSG